MEHLPAAAPQMVVQLPDGSHAYTPLPVQAQQQLPQIVHVHQAAPDRTVQRLALGAGAGAGAVGAAVYFGPLLIAAITSMAISLAVVALVVVAVGWATVTVVRTVTGASSSRTGR